MKVITEALLREELRASEPETYYVEDGRILSPAAREYLQQRKINIAKKGQKEEVKVVATKVPDPEPVAIEKQEKVEVPKPKYVDYDTGAFYYEKPEHMTQLSGNRLVAKSHRRIHFRGKLDSLQALVVLDQAILAETEGNEKLIEDLGDILGNLREMMKCEVLDEPFELETIIGLTHAELRERSHHPQKFFNIKQMILPDYTMGKAYGLLNQLRAAIRETEVAAAEAFREGNKYTRGDIIEELNRLSSAVHIMMCMYLAGRYDSK